MIKAKELIEWLQTLPEGAHVGIDDCSLTLDCHELDECFEVGMIIPIRQEKDDRDR